MILQRPRFCSAKEPKVLLTRYRGRNRVSMASFLLRTWSFVLWCLSAQASMEVASRIQHHQSILLGWLRNDVCSGHAAPDVLSASERHSLLKYPNVVCGSPEHSGMLLGCEWFCLCSPECVQKKGLVINFLTMFGHGHEVFGY